VLYTIIIIYYYTLLLLYTIILYIIHIIYYTILFSSFSLLLLPLSSFQILLILIHHPIFILYLSVLTYTYLYSINISPNLTTFYRSGCLEWCSFICVVFWWMVIVFRSDCKVFGCISSKSEQNWCFVLDLTLGVYCILVLYYILSYIYYSILYYILSYLLSSS
jgi:hypothetical protein